MELMLFNNIRYTPESHTERLQFNDLRDFYEFLRVNITTGTDKVGNKAFSICEYKTDMTPNTKGNIRHKENAKQAHIAVIDFDDGNLDNLKILEEAIKEYRYIKYSSFSHGLKKEEFHKFRFILELEQPIKCHEMFKAYMYMMNIVAFKKLNTNEATTLSQTFFIPMTNTNSETICEVTYNEGNLLEVREGYTAEPMSEEDKRLLADYSDGTVERTSIIPTEKLDALIASKMKSKFIEHNIEGELLRELIDTGDFDKNTMIGEHNGLLKLGTALGWYLPFTDVEAILELFSRVESKYGRPEIERNVVCGIQTGQEKRIKDDAKWKQKRAKELSRIFPRGVFYIDPKESILLDSLGTEDIPKKVYHNKVAWDYNSETYEYVKRDIEFESVMDRVTEGYRQMEKDSKAFSYFEKLTTTAATVGR